jgi:hypothetical protein
MDSGQTFYNGMRTNGGWYVSGPQLRHALVSMFRGAQATPPAGDSAGLSTGSVVGIAAAGTGVLLALALLLVTHVRRRSRRAVTA